MNNHIKANKSERGQAIVLIVLSIVGLFGFAALALDMGQIYMARRSAQAAADAAALAAADDAVIGSKNATVAISKAFVMASNNGYNNDKKTNWVVVKNPPENSPYCGSCGALTNDYYQVRIKVRVKPIFAQLFFNGAEQTEVEAIAHGKPAGSLTENDAIVSLSKGSDSFTFDGNTSSYVDGGNIRSFGDMTKNGASGGITVVNGKVFYAGDFKGHTSPFSPQPEKASLLDGLPSFAAPYCPTAAEAATWTNAGAYRTKNINGVDYYYYASGLSVENLGKGIHCIEGGIGKGNYKGSGVLIVLLSGGIQQTGHDSIDFSCASDLKDVNGNQFGGLVFYAPPTNTSTFKFGGNSDAYINGTFFAPGANCTIGGTPDGRADHAAFVCYTVTIHGNPVFNVNYNPAELFHTAALISLVQ